MLNKFAELIYVFTVKRKRVVSLKQHLLYLKLFAIQKCNQKCTFERFIYAASSYFGLSFSWF